VRETACAYLCIQWSTEQIASKLPISHETIYQHVYAEKAQVSPTDDLGQRQ